MKLTTTLSPKNASIVGGYAGGPGVDFCRWADEIGPFSGPWLCCYMLRRFGWPNAGSDDHKQLCTWSLTTPVPGLYLAVTPYLGGSNLHFAVRFNKDVGRELGRDPGRDAFFRRFNRAVEKWWARHGSNLYVFGTGKKEGDDELIHVFAERENFVAGLWGRKPCHKRLPRAFPKANMIHWWLGEFIKSKHPEAKLPKMTQRERAQRPTAFQRRASAALKATLLDLTRPTSVRDISFSPFGDIERTPDAVSRFKGQESVSRWVGAGYAVEYWFTEATPKERRGES